MESPRTAGSTSLDILPPSGKGISAELNPEETVVGPSIHTSNSDITFARIEEFDGKTSKTKTPIGNACIMQAFEWFSHASTKFVSSASLTSQSETAKEMIN